MAKAVGQPYRAPKASVEWKPTKWDGFKLVKTEHGYRHQKGSGRSECFELAEDGITVGEWTRRCAEKGFDSKFVTGSLLKLQGAKQKGWAVSDTDDQGRTMAQVKSDREVDAEKAAAKAAKAAADAEARAALSAQRKIERDQAKALKAEEKALRDAAKRQENEAKAQENAATQEGEANDAKAPAKKSKRKGAAPEAEAA